MAAHQQTSWTDLLQILVNYMFTFPINPSDGSLYMYKRMHIKLFSTENLYTMLFLHLAKTAPICLRCLHVQNV